MYLVVHVVTGPLFERHIANIARRCDGRNSQQRYRKVLFTGTTPSKVKRNTLRLLWIRIRPVRRTSCDYRVTVEAIEHKTKPVLTLWSACLEAVASEVKTTKGKVWRRS